MNFDTIISGWLVKFGVPGYHGMDFEEACLLNEPDEKIPVALDINNRCVQDEPTNIVGYAVLTMLDEGIYCVCHVNGEKFWFDPKSFTFFANGIKQVNHTVMQMHVRMVGLSEETQIKTTYVEKITKGEET